MQQVRLAVVGHRGAMAEAPENTIASYRAAEEIGVDEVETDVRISADGQLFMLHDATLDRVAARPEGKELGPTSELDWSTISAVDVGAGERVPTLEQMYAATTRTIQLEIKDLAVLDALVGYLDDHPAEAARTVLTSFSAEAMAAVSRRLPTIPRGVIVGSWDTALSYPGGPEALIKETGSSRVHTGWAGLTAETVSSLHDAGVGVHGWPCRERTDLERAVEFGVDGTTSDDPRTLLGWFG
ncbi:glycerophosphoryl diester phosphodiesterase [Microlunatus endophyticus]|uniref:Glycerophosphoryl diester phosphodiesterase n=1 Tax=Microlunatus endophyticus TaxID=1716077 RepID=A0A917S4J1_9ACTN|nr:glycerophosphoryl diester phosphodiesterase [Microlunatus endophyticus]